MNGRATITTDAVLLEACEVEGKTPKLGILIDIEQAYTHCSKAFIRSELWNPERFTIRDALPSAGQLLRAVSGADLDADNYDRDRAARYSRREGFY